MCTYPMLLALDIGGTLIKWGIFENFQSLTSGTLPCPNKQGGAVILMTILQLIQTLRVTYPLEGIAISAAGVIDPDRGYVRSASNTIKDYEALAIKDDLQKETGLPVSVENDVNCALLAEQKQGRSSHSSSTFMINIGTGVGGAFFVNGAIHHGICDHAGELGYLSIDQTRLDDSGSMRCLLQRIAKRKHLKDVSLNGYQIFQWYRDGDQISTEEIHRSLQTIAKAITFIAQLLNPECIIIGGGMSNEEKIILPIINGYCKVEMSAFLYENTTIQCASLKNNAGMIGALYHFQQLYNVEKL